VGQTFGESGDRKTKFKKLLSSVSGAALLLGVAVGSVRGGTTITTTTPSVTNAGATDFIFIDTGGLVLGSVTNSGLLGVPPFTVPQPLVVKIGSKFDAFKFLGKMLATRPADVDAWERDRGYPLLKDPVFAYNSAEWRASAERQQLNLVTDK